MRVTSELWVSALCRKAASEGAFAFVARRGAASAGAIFVITTAMDGNASLYAPALQAQYDGDGHERWFECVLADVPETEVKDKLLSESKFDSDIWVVEIEDQRTRHFIENIVD